jgi:hypothetical protein
MSCDACLTCPNYGRLWWLRWLEGIKAFSSSENFALSDWWHFRWWVFGLVSACAYRWITPKDPK